MRAARGPLRPGARVGSFVVREEIGEGATSIVYEAEHRTLRHRVAVKVLRSASEMQSELRWRFEREMHLCVGLTSMHVPRVYEVGELPSGLPYIVMERLSGATLGEWLSAHRRIPIAVVVEIGIQLCAALASLHERSVIHRDVKPENLVLHQAFEGGYVLKLVDFGICKPLLGDGRAVTQQGIVVGTPEYMSPEQIQGIAVDARTDVYSSGIVLYELLTGGTPFEDRDLDRLGHSILFRPPPRISSVRAEVSAALEGIVMRAIARDRTNRYPSIRALQRDLSRFADEQALRRHPHVWGLMPASPAQKRAGTPPSAAADARARPTLIMPRIPVRRSGLIGGASAGVAVLLAALFSVAYVARDSGPASPIAIEDLPSPAQDEPEAAPSPHAPVPSPRVLRPLDPASARRQDPTSTALDAPARTEVRADVHPLPLREPERTDSGRRRRRARTTRSGVPPRALTTTVGFGPQASLPVVGDEAEPPGPASLERPTGSEAAMSIRAADLYAQIDQAAAASSAHGAQSPTPRSAEEPFPTNPF